VTTGGFPVGFRPGAILVDAHRGRVIESFHFGAAGCRSGGQIAI
jgi:hypothetical protein